MQNQCDVCCCYIYFIHTLFRSVELPGSAKRGDFNKVSSVSVFRSDEIGFFLFGQIDPDDGPLLTGTARPLAGVSACFDLASAFE